MLLIFNFAFLSLIVHQIVGQSYGQRRPCFAENYAAPVGDYDASGVALMPGQNPFDIPPPIGQQPHQTPHQTPHQQPPHRPPPPHLPPHPPPHRQPQHPSAEAPEHPESAEPEPPAEPAVEEVDGVDSQQPPNDADIERKTCSKAGAEPMSVTELCSLPPHKGTGSDDIFRYYYNPVVQQCLPFSYSGKGGNSNRFVSVKNCYEICHPADPQVKKPRVVSAIRAYLVPNLSADCPKEKRRPQEAREVVVRHLPHPLDPQKTLTVVQNAQYVGRPQHLQYDASKAKSVELN